MVLDPLPKLCKADSGNCFAVYCFVCCYSISFSNSGLFQLLGHADGSKHKKLVKLRKDKGQKQLFNSPVSGGSQQEGSDTERKGHTVFLKPLSINDQNAKAEALWAMKVASEGYSYS